MAQEIYNPHDLFLKATLSSPQAIQDFFQAHLPAHLLKRIDLHTIKPTHLLDMTLTEDKTLAGHGSVSLMEKLMKYSRDRDLFKVISQELASVRDWLLGRGMRVHPIGFDYWETVLLYTSSVLNPKYHSAEELVALF